MTHYTAEQFIALLAEYYGDGQALTSVVERINRWLARGDGAAVYTDHDLGHPDRGSLKIASFGSPAAQLETDAPPDRLPDIGDSINWRYWLDGVYRGPLLRASLPLRLEVSRG